MRQFLGCHDDSSHLYRSFLRRFRRFRRDADRISISGQAQPQRDAGDRHQTKPHRL